MTDRVPETSRDRPGVAGLFRDYRFPYDVTALGRIVPWQADAEQSVVQLAEVVLQTFCDPLLSRIKPILDVTERHPVVVKFKKDTQKVPQTLVHSYLSPPADGVRGY